MDYEYEIAYQDYQESQKEQAILYAAYFISKGIMNRTDAITTAKRAVNEIYETPSGEENDWLLDEIAEKFKLPHRDQLNSAQVKAIAKDIESEFDFFPPN